MAPKPRNSRVPVRASCDVAQTLVSAASTLVSTLFGPGNIRDRTCETAYLALAALVACSAFGQSTSSPPASPAFEVADVHVSARSSNPSVQPFDSNAYAADRMKGGFVRGGLYMLRTATMVDLIRTAFGVDADHVMGGPTWLEMDRFDVIARAPADATAEALKL